MKKSQGGKRYELWQIFLRITVMIQPAPEKGIWGWESIPSAN